LVPQLLIQPVDYFLLAWFTLSATSVLYVEVGPGQRYDVIWWRAILENG
jgi:hypothetical protein